MNVLKCVQLFKGRHLLIVNVDCELSKVLIFADPTRGHVQSTNLLVGYVSLQSTPRSLHGSVSHTDIVKKKKKTGLCL